MSPADTEVRLSDGLVALGARWPSIERYRPDRCRLHTNGPPQDLENELVTSLSPHKINPPPPRHGIRPVHPMDPLLAVLLKHLPPNSHCLQTMPKRSHVKENRQDNPAVAKKVTTPRSEKMSRSEKASGWICGSLRRFTCRFLSLPTCWLVPIASCATAGKGKRVGRER